MWLSSWKIDLTTGEGSISRKVPLLGKTFQASKVPVGVALLLSGEECHLVCNLTSLLADIACVPVI